MAGNPQIEHLLRRAGFGARPDEIVLFGQMSTAQAVDALGNYQSVADEVDTFLGKAGYIGTTSNGAFAPQSNINNARQRWIFRMVRTGRPLQEKMTLFWHNHFATAYSKIAGALGAAEGARYMAAKSSEDPGRVRGQIEMFRDNGARIHLRPQHDRSYIGGPERPALQKLKGPPYKPERPALQRLMT